MLSLIAAYGQGRELGFEGRIPWRLSGDFRHVKEVTLGKTLLMGRKTFESLPGVLPGRDHIIVTANPDFTMEHPRVRIVHDLAGILAECAALETEVVVFGGASLYRAALPYVRTMYITHVYGSFPADTFFPEWDETLWRIADSSQLLNEKGLAYRWITYERRGQNE